MTKCSLFEWPIVKQYFDSVKFVYKLITISQEVEVDVTSRMASNLTYFDYSLHDVMEYFLTHIHNILFLADSYSE